jgi:cell division septum initiation protein DivIVA
MKKLEVKTMIRKIVREEVAMAIQEVITELKKPLTEQQNMTSKKKTVQSKKIKKQKHTSKTALNEVLNETADSDEWKTLGDGTYTTDKMSDLLQDSYGDLMNGNGTGTTKNNMVASMGVDPDSVPDHVASALTKDYRGLMKVIDKKATERTS